MQYILKSIVLLVGIQFKIKYHVLVIRILFTVFLITINVTIVLGQTNLLLFYLNIYSPAYTKFMSHATNHFSINIESQYLLDSFMYHFYVSIKFILPSKF